MKLITHEERRDIIYKALKNNHDRVTLSEEIKVVRFAFLVNDPEGRKILKPEQAIVHARLLKTLIRKYLNKYRRRRSGKRVIGYSWVMHTERDRNKPYIHILFYVSATAYDEMMPEPRHEAQVVSSEQSGEFVEVSTQKATDNALSVISDIGYYWTAICSSEGHTGAAVSYNIDKGRKLLSHGDHPHLKLLEHYDIVTDLNGDDAHVLNKLHVTDKQVYRYLYRISQEAYFLPKERSFGVSYRGKNKVSENEPLTIPESDDQ